MNILMMTNTYKPIVGGLERSIEIFADEYRKRGHHVKIVVPRFKNMIEERDVVRVPGLQNFNGTDFSVQIPIPGILTKVLQKFRPDIVHAHHPFLMGDAALRVATRYRVPMVFTHHSLYEENIHYVPGNAKMLKRFVISLSTGFANLCDQVFVPSCSVGKLLKSRGVRSPIEVVPTGIYVDDFAQGDGETIRAQYAIPTRAFVVGYLGRIAPEKNIEFLAKAVGGFLKKNKNAHFLVVGDGPSRDVLENIFLKNGISNRIHLTGKLRDEKLINAYHAMDVFAFASHSETQGLVLAEAMASGVPVVAVHAPGVCDILENEVNGRILETDNRKKFREALEWVANFSEDKKALLGTQARLTARRWSVDVCVDQALELYTQAIQREYINPSVRRSPWETTKRLIKMEWGLLKNFTQATGRAAIGPELIKNVKKRKFLTRSTRLLQRGTTRRIL